MRMNSGSKSTRKVGLFKAFSILIAGDERVRGYRWKKLLINGAIAGTVCFPLFCYNHSLPFQGRKPPDTPVVTSTGTFIKTLEGYGPRSRLNSDFHTVDGRVWRVEGGEIPEVRDYYDQHFGAELQVQGFFLLNGHGQFWPTSIKTINGQILLDSETAKKRLAVVSAPFAGLPDLYVLVAVLWIISLSNALKIQNQFNMGY